MIEVRKANPKVETCLNCGKPIDREVVISYKPWYITHVQLCEDCLKLALEELIANTKGEDEE